MRCRNVCEVGFGREVGVEYSISITQCGLNAQWGLEYPIRINPLPLSIPGLSSSTSKLQNLFEGILMVIVISNSVA